MYVCTLVNITSTARHSYNDVRIKPQIYWYETVAGHEILQLFVSCCKTYVRTS